MARFGMLTAVKFCGLCRAEDAAAAAAVGAQYAGVILSAVGPRAQNQEAAARIFEAAVGVRRVGVFVDEAPDAVRSAARVLGLDVVQLHGSEPADVVKRLRDRAVWRIWKAIRPRDEAEFLAGINAWDGLVDGLLLDGGSTAQAGGTGTAFPWGAVEPNRGRVPRGMELIVAGGLGPGNVGEAVRRLSPDVVDVSSGVESGVCVKSESLMGRFVTAVRAVDRSRGEEGGNDGRRVGSA